MPRWGDKDVCHLQMIDAIGDYSKSLTKQTTTNTGKNKKIQLKSARRNCRSHLNHKLFIENFIYDPLNVFFNPIGTHINRIMWRDFRGTKNKSTNFQNVQKKL